MKSSHTKGFTLIELIFVIVIIGVLTSVAIPKYQNLTDNAKISSELATASSVQSALDATHGDWITNTCEFTWGNELNSSKLNDKGYPDTITYPDLMGNTADPFKYILKNAENGDWSRNDSFTPPRYYGPASNLLKGAKDRAGLEHKPNKGEWWEYNSTAGTFTLKP